MIINDYKYQGYEVGLVHGQERRADVEGGVGEQGEEAGGVDEELRAQSVGAHALEDDVVCLERLLVDAGREVGVHALGEPLADQDPGGMMGYFIIIIIIIIIITCGG